MIVPVKKEWKGIVSVRSYQVDYCINRGENMIIKLNDRKMTLTPQQLSDKSFIVSSKEIRSKINPGQVYKLIYYKFRED